MIRYLRQVLVLAAIATFIGLFSVAPGYTHHPPDMAMIRLSFAHGAPRTECRRLSPAELARVAPNMRRPAECPRGRPSVFVTLELDGRPAFEALLPPSGLSGDGPSRFYRGLTVLPGPHRLRLGLRDTARDTGFDYTRSFDVTLVPTQHLTIDFDSGAGGFFLRDARTP